MTKTKNMKTQKRAGVRKPTRGTSRTASKARVTRKAAVSVHRENPPPHPPPHEQWATCAPPDAFSLGRYRLCLWGDKASAVENRDPDERVCRVHITVLEVV